MGKGRESIRIEDFSPETLVVIRNAMRERVYLETQAVKEWERRGACPHESCLSSIGMGIIKTQRDELKKELAKLNEIVTPMEKTA